MMKLGIIVPDEEMGRLSVSVGYEMGVEMHWTILEENGRSEIECARALMAGHHVEGIIARNPSGYLLEQTLDIPICILHISRMDILRAAQQITPHKTAAFLYVPEDKNKYDFDLNELEDIPNHPIRIFATGKSGVSRSVVDEAYLSETLGLDLSDLLSCEALVSGTPKLIRFFQRHGLETSVIQFDAFELRSAISSLIKMIRSRYQEMRHSRLMEMALNTTNDGFLVLENRRLVMANENVCDMAGVKKDKIVQRTEHCLMRNYPFFQMVFSVNKKEIINYNDRPYSVFRRHLTSPLLDDEGVETELISIIDVPKIQKTETAIRKALTSSGFVAKWNFQDIIARSGRMLSTIQAGKQYANSDLSVLILGESGTGKEVFAQSMHNASPFARGPFVALNCAALPDNLIESELFGYEEGAFTGAKKGGKTGLFELSHGGTLFLDEIGELPLLMQAKLLRSLQEKCIYRVGGDRMIPIRNRLICATNQDLYSLVKQRKFREDLLYRINALQIQIPPLRDRKEDIPLFVRKFFQDNLRHGVEDEILKGLSDVFMNYDWPGNVRELENYMSRLLVMRRGGTSLEQISRYMDETLIPSLRLSDATAPIPLEDSDEIQLHMGTFAEMEEQLLKEVYERCSRNIQHTAQRLNIGYSTVWRKLKKYHASF